MFISYIVGKMSYNDIFFNSVISTCMNETLQCLWHGQDEDDKGKLL